MRAAARTTDPPALADRPGPHRPGSPRPRPHAPHSRCMGSSDSRPHVLAIMLARLTRYLKRTALLLVVVGATLLGVRAWDSQRGGGLELWHTHVPREMHALALDKADWVAYLAAEDAIFRTLKAEVVDRLDEASRMPGNRYFAGSPIYPVSFAQDREIPAPCFAASTITPREGGPFARISPGTARISRSLRSLGHAAGYWPGTVCCPIPGHSRHKARDSRWRRPTRRCP